MMNYNFSEITYPSKDGKNTVYACLYTPKHCTARGIVQIVHGMVDHIERYEQLADFLTGEGYIVAGNNHLGHAKTAPTEEELGYFGDESAVDFLVSDIHTLNRYLRDTFPALPLVIFGHSMGSFLTRLYIEKHPNSIKGAIIHGTSGPLRVVSAGKLLASLIIKARGRRHRSELLARIAFMGYNSHFDKSEGDFAWLSRDAEAIKPRDSDPYAKFLFTVSAYKDLFSMLERCNKKSWFENYPAALPTLVVSGDEDPVGQYGKGPKIVYKKLLVAGAKGVSLKIYSGARHELFLETNRQEVFSDLLVWLNGVTDTAMA